MKLLLNTIVICLMSFLTIMGQTATVPSSGTGTSGDPYQIATLENLYWITATDDVVASPTQATRWAAYYIQTANIDASSTSTWDNPAGGTVEGWLPIGNSSTAFTGSYDGNGHTISGIYTNTWRIYTGLFGSTSGGFISNLGVINVSITQGNGLGGLVGANGSNVSNCYSTGSVSGTQYIGGLIGLNSGTVRNSYSSCSVTGYSAVGGFTATNGGLVENCYSTGNVTRESGADDTGFGGFVGWQSGNVRYCYSTGSVTYTGVSSPTDKGFSGQTSGTYTANFFDQTTSGQTSSTGAAAKTTTEMQTQTTFTAAGWNFTSLWKMIGTNYPTLYPEIFVKYNAAGSNNGTSWTNAYTSLQSALDLATTGKQIWVAKGTYKPSSAYDLTNSSRFYHFRMKDGVAIYGGFTGTETAITQRTDFAVDGVNETILSGDIGVADVHTDNCYHIFYHPESSALTSSAILNGFTIEYGYSNGTINDVRGGGMHNRAGNAPTLDQCSFLNNYAQYGGGIYNLDCSPTFNNCVFNSNTATRWGGGIYNTTGASPSITNCLIVNNISNTTGGGIYSYDFDGGTNPCAPVLTNTTIANNSAIHCGGVRIYNSSTTLNNCIIWGNTHTGVGAGSQISMDGPNANTTTTLNYTCYSNGVNDVNGTPTISNCITTDPQFVGSGTNPFSIIGLSACTDAGDDSYNTTMYDIRGSGFDRKLNKTDGASGTIDMGAYEYKFGIDPLPVELTSFSATTVGSTVKLSWNTATEINNYGFEIERNTPLNPLSRGEAEGWDVWQKIGFVNGNGNSNSPKDYSFVDDKVNVGKYSYRLKQIDNDGQYEYSKIIEVSFIKPNEFSLEQNYPNPFNPTTTINYQIPSAGHVSLKIYDLLGAEVMALVNTAQVQGRYELSFDASQLSSGVYIYRIQVYMQGLANPYIASKQMMLLK